MINELSLEDLAMGKLPKESKKGEKPLPVSDAIKAKVKKMANMALMQEGLSVKSLKKLNKAELEVLINAADRLQDTLYRTKEMAREAGESNKGHGIEY